ncbi:MAG: hypothetical protein ABI679_11555, partial [Gemmatimonadota bacterium]
TMIYYDQGMFEEVNYMTSAVPAEVLAGGVSINMVTKVGGNTWKGNVRYSYSNNDLQDENWAPTQRSGLETFRQSESECLRPPPGSSNQRWP